MKDSLNRKLGYALSRASATMIARLNTQLQPLGLRTVDASILVLIADNPGLSQSDLCRMLDIASANMVPLMARLNQRGLVERHKADGRSYGLMLSNAGAALAAAAEAEMARHDQWLADLIDPVEREVIERFLTRIRSETAVAPVDMATA